MRWISILAAVLAGCLTPATDAANPAPIFAIADAKAIEGGDLVFVITKNAQAKSYSQLQFGLINGTALDGRDYVRGIAPAGVVLTFGNKELKKTIVVHTLDNGAVDGIRELTASIKPIRFAAVPNPRALGRILDNDVVPTPAPLPTQTCPDGTVILAALTCPPAPTPPPAPGPAPSGSDILTPSLAGVPQIPDNFDAEAEKVPSGVVTKTAAPDFGAFRFVCGPGQILADDPILFPGQPGKSHLHQFFGNTKADANSTYESLRAAGESTCQSKLNRSAYWIPALLDGKGNVIRPDIFAVYYKRWPTWDFHCNVQGGYPTRFNVEGERCLPIPNGLKFIAGWDPTGKNDAPTGALQFLCIEDLVNNEDFEQALARCKAKQATDPDGIVHIAFRMDAPNCWDGKRLDSTDHRSHVAYAKYSNNPDGSDGWGYPRCPATHPNVIPTFTLNATFSLLTTDDFAKLTWSCDAMLPGQKRGKCGHMDYFEAWGATKQTGMENCLEKQLDGQGGDLCDGRRLKTYAGFTEHANPRLVPMPAPAMPGGM